MRRILVPLALVVALVMVAVAGCGQSSPDNGSATDPSGGPEQIKIGGSSTLAPVIATLADDFMEEYKTWNNVDPTLPKEPIVIFVSTGGSGFGVRAALDGTFDVGLLARELSADEEAALSEGETHKLAVEALTIAVHADNPVAEAKPDLTTDELRQIFAGEIGKWNELADGLPDQSIVLAVRDAGGGASIVFDECVMHGTPVSADAQQQPSMGALAGKVMDNVSAIGYVSSGLVNQNADRFRVLSVDGVPPTTENIASGDYKIGRPLLLVTKEEPDAALRAFLDYVMSDHGLQVAEDMGFVPVTN